MREVDRFFTPTRIPNTDRARAVIRRIMDDLDGYQKDKSIRKRKRRQADQATFETTITALVCDLMHYHLLADERPLVIPQSKRVLGVRDRYRHPALNQKLPEWLKELSSPELGWIRLSRGHTKEFGPNQRSRIAPSERFVSLMDDHEIELEDLGVSKPTEVIILKAPKEAYDKKAKLLQYDDNLSTNLWREQMIKLNDWLAKADIEFDDRVMAELKPVDPNDRYLRRSFNNGSFSKGGRLGGGFWMGLHKDERINGITINGERVVSLDYGQSTHRIVYGLAGIEPPKDDLYAIPGIDPRYREGVKRLMSALMYSKDIPTKKPKDFSKILPKASVGTLCELIRKAHSQMNNYYPSLIGYEASFIESEVLMTVLMELMDQGIVALPVHDCVIVQRSNEGIARSVMLNKFKAVAKVDGKVETEGVSKMGHTLMSLIHSSHSFIE